MSMTESLGKIRNDPVWAAVAAGIILAILAWVWGKFPSNTVIVSRTFPIPLWLIIIVLSALIGTFWRLVTQREAAIQGTYHFEPKVTLVSVDADLAPPESKLTYPPKCSAFLRNDSKGCVDIMLANYQQDRIPIKAFRQGVLQIEVAPAGWVRTDYGAHRIAVFPNQNFRFWIPIDEKKYSPDEVRGARKQIGTLIFKMNRAEVQVKI